MKPAWFRGELFPTSTGPDVEVVQRKLGQQVTGIYDEETAALVRGLQIKLGLEVTGLVDDNTAEALGERAAAGQVPDWYTRDLQLWDEGDDVAALRLALGMTNGDNRFDPDVEAHIRRFQSEHGIDPTGEVDENLAILIHDTYPSN